MNGADVVKFQHALGVKSGIAIGLSRAVSTSGNVQHKLGRKRWGMVVAAVIMSGDTSRSQKVDRRTET